MYLLGLLQLLSKHPEFEVLATCADCEDALQAVRKHRPDLLVGDFQSPRVHGLSLLKKVQAEGLKPKVVILTAGLDENALLDGMLHGVRGVVLKTMAPDLLIRCLRKVHAGEEWLEIRATSLALEKLLHRESQTACSRNPLTHREMELMCLATKGLNNREIAGQLFIAEGTVKAHLHKIFDKLQVRNRVELSAVARDNGWI